MSVRFLPLPTPLTSGLAAALIAMALCAPAPDGAQAHPHPSRHGVRGHHAKTPANVSAMMKRHGKRHSALTRKHRKSAAARHRHAHRSALHGPAESVGHIVIADYYCTTTRNNLRVRYRFKGETPVSAQLTYLDQTHHLLVDPAAAKRAEIEDTLRFSNVEGYEWSTTNFTRSTFAASEAHVLTRGYELQTKSCKKTRVSS